jgi:hypothetical protein
VSIGLAGGDGVNCADTTCLLHGRRGESMHRTARTTLVVLLALTALLIPAAGVAADAGLTLTADTATLGPHRTSVALRGTYSCGPFASGRPDRGVIDLSVEQRQSSGTVTAFGFLEPAVCDGTSQPFEVTLTGNGGKRFREGTASWSASGYVEGDTGLQHIQVPPTPIVLMR